MVSEVGVRAMTLISAVMSIRCWRMVSRVRKKLALMKYWPEAAGMPALAVLKVQLLCAVGTDEVSEMQSVGLATNGASGSVLAVPVRHLPGEAMMVVPLASFTGASEVAVGSSSTQCAPGTHCRSGETFTPVAGLMLTGEQKLLLPCLGASTATTIMPFCTRLSAASSIAVREPPRPCWKTVSGTQLPGASAASAPEQVIRLGLLGLGTAMMTSIASGTPLVGSRRKAPV